MDRGDELRRSFTVKVTHQGKPLPRVSVQITGNSEGANPQTLSELTSGNGTAHFENLPPGNYWIKADLLGIGAAHECFHIKSSARKAKKDRRYDWGDEPVSVAQAVGRLVDSQPGKGRSPRQNLRHREKRRKWDCTNPLQAQRTQLFRTPMATLRSTQYLTGLMFFMLTQEQPPETGHLMHPIY
jgi:hypothetical protein